MFAEDGTERVISGTPEEDDISLDTTLRPKRLAEFLGQEKVKENLRIAVAAAQGGMSPWIIFCSMVLRALVRPRWPTSLPPR